MVAEAVTNALNDGKVAYQEIQQAVVGYVDGMYFIFAIEFMCNELISVFQ